MPPHRLAQAYRSCLFQIIIVGLVGLCEPGMWTALNNLGAGGNASVGFPADAPISYCNLSPRGLD